MSFKSYLSEELDSAGSDAQYNIHALRLLKDKGVLAYILKGTVGEFNSCSIDEIKRSINDDIEIRKRKVRPEAIRGNNTESSIPGEGSMYFDIVFTVRIGDGEDAMLYINVEAQKSFYPGYDLTTRGIIYAARLISSQMDVEFTAQDYDGVKKVYSIWICMNAPVKNVSYDQVSDTIVKYSISPEVLYTPEGAGEVAKGRYDLMSVVFINLNARVTGQSGNKLIGMLSTLLSAEKKVDEKKAILEQDYNLPMTVEMEKEAAVMCNLSDTIAIELRQELASERAEKEKALAEKEKAWAEARKAQEELTRLKAQLANA